MLATLTEERFSSPDWIFERKVDGIRALAIRDDGGGTELWSRNRKSLGYPSLREALDERGPDRFVADGEVVAFDGDQTSFAKLQGIARSGGTVYLYLFDLLVLGDTDLTRKPLRTRKQLLREAFDFGGPLRFSAHRNEHGEAFYDEACEKGWEGLIAKRADSSYISGRSKDWLKFKCVAGQEFVVGGYTDPQGMRQGIGALLVGYFQGDRFRYAGKVGTGYSYETLRMLKNRLGKRKRESSPFADQVKEKGAHWVRPELVAQIGFTEWTSAGRLRHPRYLGLREDKAAREVVREG
jgi:bifunctional non-homologous end joining protein LigD